MKKKVYVIRKKWFFWKEPLSLYAHYKKTTGMIAFLFDWKEDNYKIMFFNTVFSLFMVEIPTIYKEKP